MGENGRTPLRVTAGLGNADQLKAYADAGADELFFGYVPEKWMRRWGLLLPLNRRESRYVNVQAGGMNEVRLLGQQARDRGIPLAVTLNALYYIPDQLPAAEELVLRLREEGFDTLIIGDLGLLWYLKERGALEGARIHLSGEAGEVNHGMLPLLKGLGVTRVIFHRKTSHGDRAGLIRRFRESPEGAGAEFEAFAMNEACHYTGAYCAGAHLEECPPLCRVEWRLGPAGPAATVKKIGSAGTLKTLGPAGTLENPAGTLKTLGPAGTLENPAGTLKNPGSADTLKKTAGTLKESAETLKNTAGTLKNPGSADTLKKTADTLKKTAGTLKNTADTLKNTGCALCGLPLLAEEGITHLKVVGRGAHARDMAQAIALVKKAAGLAAQAAGEEYRGELRRLLGGGACARECYYPEWDFLKRR